MTNNLQTWGRRAKRWSQALRNAPLVALTVTVSVSLEAFGWGYIFLTNHERSDILGASIPLALVEAIIVSATGLLAIVASFVAAERRQDARPEQRRSAWVAQFLAVVLIVPPMVKAADSFAFPAQVDAAAAYRASDEYQSNLTNSRSNNVDSLVRAGATAALARGTPPTRSQFDLIWIGSFMWAAFLYGANMIAASTLWRAKPESPAERERREKAAQRERNRRRKDMLRMAELEVEAAKARVEGRPSFIKALFNGGRKAA